MPLANSCAKARTLTAAGPSPPLRERGRPTTTSIGSYSSTNCRNRRWAAGTSRPGTVSTGVARIPSGSHEATPIRASPTSMASRRPLRIFSTVSYVSYLFLRVLLGGVGDETLHGVHGVTDGGRVLAAALGDVRLAATAAAEGLGGRAHQVTGLEAALAGGLVGGDDGQRLAVVDREQGDHGGPAALDAAAHVEDQLAQVVRGGAVRDLSGDQR